MIWPTELDEKGMELFQKELKAAGCACFPSHMHNHRVVILGDEPAMCATYEWKALYQVWRRLDAEVA